jgi:hypothetical protein
LIRHTVTPLKAGSDQQGGGTRQSSRVRGAPPPSDANYPDSPSERPRKPKTTTPSDANSPSEEPTYEVIKILDSKIKKGKCEFLVHYKGYKTSGDWGSQDGLQE